MFTAASFKRNLQKFIILHLVARDELTELLAEGLFNTLSHFLKGKPLETSRVISISLKSPLAVLNIAPLNITEQHPSHQSFPNGGKASFSKTFNMVSYTILMSKVNLHSPDGWTTNWRKNWLG